MKRALPPLLAMAVILVGLSVGSLLLPDSAFSANENRYLKQAPRLTWDALMNGSYTADVETYTADQIALRDVWMGAKSTLQQLTGKQDVGGVWLGEDGYYFAKMTEDDFNRPRYEKNLAAVKAFFDGNADKDCRILLAPTPCVVLYDKLPLGLSLDNGTVFDVDACYDTLIQQFGQQAILTRWDLREVGGGTQQVYYRTDHHWTTAGAYRAYVKIAEKLGMGEECLPETYFTKEKIPGFYGTTAARGNFVFCENDVLEIWTAGDDGDYSVVADGKEIGGFYDRSRLDTSDKYSVFLGGTHGTTVITKKGGENRKKMLIIKDSFANCLIPFLARGFDIVALDIKSGVDIAQAVRTYGADVILVVCNAENVVSDGSLGRIY